MKRTLLLCTLFFSLSIWLCAEEILDKKYKIIQESNSVTIWSLDSKLVNGHYEGDYLARNNKNQFLYNLLDQIQMSSYSCDSLAVFLVITPNTADKIKWVFYKNNSVITTLEMNLSLYEEFQSR